MRTGRQLTAKFISYKVWDVDCRVVFLFKNLSNVLNYGTPYEKPAIPAGFSYGWVAYSRWALT